MVGVAALIGSTSLNCIFPFFTYVESSGLLGESLPQARVSVTTATTTTTYTRAARVYVISCCAAQGQHILCRAYITACTYIHAHAQQVLFYTRMMTDIVGRLLPRRKALAITAPAGLAALSGGIILLSAGFLAYLRVRWGLTPPDRV